MPDGTFGRKCDECNRTDNNFKIRLFQPSQRFKARFYCPQHYGEKVATCDVHRGEVLMDNIKAEFDSHPLKGECWHVCVDCDIPERWTRNGAWNRQMDDDEEY